MNLVIDLGNTNLKAYFFDGAEILHELSTSEYKLLQEKIVEYCGTCIISEVIVSSVRDDEENFIKILREIFGKVLVFGKNLSLPIEIKYKTFETLGQDRLAAVCGASVLFPGQNVLVIDAGTAITFDMLEAGKIYHGGTISPGINTRFKALHNFTGKLPLLTINKELYADFGTTTDESIILGVQNGVFHEVNGTIGAFLGKYEDLLVVFTGGDSFFFDKLIKNRIFAEPNLTAFGLNKILELNV